MEKGRNRGYGVMNEKGNPTMKCRILKAAALTAALAGCVNRSATEDRREPAGVVAGKAPGAACIEGHVEERMRGDGGAFRVRFEGRELRLTRAPGPAGPLLRTGAGRYCGGVPFEDAKGNAYEADFFLREGTGGLAVTRVAIRAVNGQPFYFWEQRKDGYWRRIPPAWASEAQQGVIRGRDSFEFGCRVTLPGLGGPARLWLPVPETDGNQVVSLKALESPGKPRLIRDRDYGNRILFVELGPEDSGGTIDLRVQVMRSETADYTYPEDGPEFYMEAGRNAPGAAEFQRIAEQVVRGRRSHQAQARAIFDHVIDRVRFAEHEAGFCHGDAVIACRDGMGDGADFHAYFIALARAAGIPARFEAGVAIPADRDGGVIAGCHAWAEWYAEGWWHPVDVSEADKHAGLADYYFGHHPANRLELSRGRDLVVDPMPASGPINFLAYPLLEVEGNRVPVEAELSFRRTDIWRMVRAVMRNLR